MQRTVIKCDLCGNETVFHPRRGIETWGLERPFHDTRASLSVSITSDAPTSFPGEPKDIAETVDICPTCLDRKVLPWLKSQGVDTDRLRLGVHSNA